MKNKLKIIQKLLFPEIFWTNIKETQKFLIDWDKYQNNCEDDSENSPYYKLLLVIIMKNGHF